MMAVRTRSPNYPAISLGEAIDYARKVFSQEHYHKASDETIAQDLGYTGLNGRSIGVISALKKYGLLVPEGDDFRLSDDAQSILEFEPSNEERRDALYKAAFMPGLFHDLYEEFGDTLPSEGNLRQFLIKRKFHPEKANDVVQIYRDTLELVTQADRAYYDAKRQKETTMREAQQIQPTTTPAATTGQQSLRSPTKEELNRIFASSTAAQLHALGVPVPDSGKELRFNISRDSEAQVIFRGPVTQEAIDKLAKLLELQKDTFPKQAELDAQEIERIADEN